MKKYEIAYHKNAEAKCAHQVQKYFVQTQQVTLCVRSKQPHTIKTIIYNDIFTSLRRKKFEAWTVQGVVQSDWLLLCTELTLFCIELSENYIYLDQSELSNFFMYLTNSVMNILTQHFSQKKLEFMHLKE